MICFEVFVNGQKRCVAGAGEYGVLDANIIWYNRIHMESEEGEDGEGADWSHNGEFRVTGYEDSDPWHGEYVKWLADPVELKPGDEMLVRVIESECADPPVERGINLSPEMEQRAKEARRDLYEKLKREFELKQEFESD